MSNYCEPNPWKGFVCGMLGSVAGLVAMGLYWQYAAPAVSQAASNGQENKNESNEDQPLDDISLVGKQHREKESSTDALGRLAYQQMTGGEPRTSEGETILSNLVHWGYGMLQGGLYGAARSSAGGLDLPGGAIYAGSLWLFGDELAVPILGLQGGPTAASPIQHANRLGAHLAYGLTTAAVTQLLRRIL